MKNSLLSIIILIGPFFVFSQVEKEGTLKANSKLTIYGNIDNIYLEEGEEISYKISDGRVSFEKKGIIVVKKTTYLKKLEKKDNIKIILPTNSQETITNNSNYSNGENEDNRKIQNKLNIIIGHLIAGDIFMIVSVIRLITVKQR
ncbi:MAG: hypothetical protein R3D00_27540 [Bacteroidia bacterium]